MCVVVVSLVCGVADANRFLIFIRLLGHIRATGECNQRRM